MMSSVGDFAGDLAPALWQRYFDIFMAGIQVRSDSPLPALPSPLTEEQLAQATGAWRPAYR